MAKATLRSTKWSIAGGRDIRTYPNINMFTSTDYVSVGRRNVNISVIMERKASGQGYIRTDVKVALQQYRNGKWNTIATRTGYVDGGDPMDRTFTNVNSAYNLRVRFNLDSYQYPRDYVYLGIYAD